jgi:hypothetical protein
VSRFAWSIGPALIGFGFASLAAAHTAPIAILFSQEAIAPIVQRDESRFIAAAASSQSPYWSHGPRATREAANIQPPQQVGSITAPQDEPRTTPPPLTVSAPAASGFFALFTEGPQSSVLAMVAMGAALCRFGSSFLRIRR